MMLVVSACHDEHYRLTKLSTFYAKREIKKGIICQEA
jgi:hypothetical protein